MTSNLEHQSALVWVLEHCIDRGNNKDKETEEENLSWQTKRPTDVVLLSDTTGLHSNPAGQ